MKSCQRPIIVLLIALISSTSPSFATDAWTLNITNYVMNNSSSTEPSLEQTGYNLTDELSLWNIVTFFRNDWYNTLKLTNRHKKYINTYLKIIKTVLENISIPRDVNAIKEFSKILVDGDENIFGHNSFFISVKEYINNLTVTPSKLLKMVNNMYLNKMKLFDRLVSSASSNEAIKYYGIVALQNILHIKSSVLEVNQSKISEINYVYQNNSNLKFIHPEYEWYYVAKYIIHESESKNSSSLNEIMLKFLEKSEYASILQYINGNINKNSIFFQNVIRNVIKQPEVFKRVLDNLIAHGFDSLTAAIFEQLNDSNIIDNYLRVNEKVESIINSNVKYYFGMLSRTNAPIKCSRQEMMIRMNMEETLEVLLGSKTHPNWNSSSLWRISDLKTYLKIIVSQSKPNEKIFRLIMKRLPLPYDVGYLSKLLYNVIINAGIEGRFVAHELISHGVNARAENIDSRTLVHIAVKSGNLDLLRFVVEELKVPIGDTSTKSILIEVLDLNPFPDFSRPQYWEMIYYLIKHGDLKVPNRSHQQLSHLPANITKDEFKELSKSFSYIISESIFSEINSTILSPDVQSLRRNLVLQNSHEQIRHKIISVLSKVEDTLTLTEILLKYRGYSKLSASEERFFERSIESALLYDTRMRPLTPNQLARIEAAISSNIGTMDDLHRTQKLLYSKIFPHLDEIERSSVARTLMTRIQNKDDPAFDHKNLTLPKMILQTKSDIYRTIVETSKHKLDEQSLIYSTLRRTCLGLRTDNYVNGLMCVFKRRRRNPTGCKISHEDVAKVMQEITTNGETSTSINADEALRWFDETSAENQATGSNLHDDISHESEHSTRQSQMIDVLDDLVRFRRMSYYGNDAAEFDELVELLDAGSVEEVLRRREANEIYTEYKKQILKGNNDLIEQIKENKRLHLVSILMTVLPMIRGVLQVAKECITWTAACATASNAMFWSSAFMATYMYAPEVIKRIFTFDLHMGIKYLKVHHRSNYDEVYAELKTKLVKREAAIGVVTHYLMQIYTIYSEIKTLLAHIGGLDKCLGTGDCPWESHLTFAVSILMTVLRINTAAFITFIRLDMILISLMFLVPTVIETLVSFILTTVVPISKSARRNNMNFLEVLRSFNPFSAYYSHVQHAELIIDRAVRIANSYLDQSDRHVAVAVSLGMVVRQINGTLLYESSPCIINMKDSKVENTQNLARIIPEENTENIRLCLPHTDLLKNETKLSADPVSTALYFCEGAIVLGNKQRWNKTSDGIISYIIDLANSAIIYGNEKYLNKFAIYNLIEESRIYGGKYQNFYEIIHAHNTTLFWDSESQYELIILSSMKALKATHHFYYYNQTHIVGELVLYPEYLIKIYWEINPYTTSQNASVAEFAGSSDKIDEIQCLDSKMVQNFAEKYFIKVDGHGGRSMSELDIVKNCPQSTLRPFTKYIITIASNTSYSIYVDPPEEKLNNSGPTTLFSTIDIQKGNVNLFFRDHTWYQKTISMEFKPNENTLTWKLQFSTDTIFVLDIKGYFPNLTEKKSYKQPQPNLQMYCNRGLKYPSPFVPIMPKNITSHTHNVTTFQATMHLLENATFQEITQRYEEMIAAKSPHIDLMVTFCKDKDCYSFGSNDSDDMHESVSYIAGFNGRDIYQLNVASPEYIWINNEAEDDQLDVLQIPESLCDSIEVYPHMIDFPSINHTEGDVIIKCSSKVRTLRINIILEKYLLNDSYQHLIIDWNEQYYMIVPPNQNYLLLNSSLNNRYMSDQLNLIRFISVRPFDDRKITSVRGDETQCFLYIPDLEFAEFEANIMDKRDVLMVHKKIPEASMQLMDFYKPDTASRSSDWATNFFISDTFSWKNVRMLQPSEIDRIVANTIQEHEGLTEMNIYLNFTIQERSTKNIIIDRDLLYKNNSMVLRFTPKLYPNDVYVRWINDKAALQICTKKCCAIVKNWCQSLHHRLKKIMFHLSYTSFRSYKNTYRQPLMIIDNIDKLECELPYNGDQNKIVDELNFRIAKAQELVEYYKKNPRPSDFEICAAFNYVDRIVHAPVFEMFEHLDDHLFKIFRSEQCGRAVTKPKIMNLTRYAVRQTVEALMTSYDIYRHLSNHSWPEKEEIFRRIRDDMAKESLDWPIFLTDLHELYFRYDKKFDSKSIVNVKKGRIAELDWTEQLLRYNQCQ